jgi:hypothetical protein
MIDVEHLRIGLYLFVTIFLAAIAIFNCVYAAQLKKVEEILSINLSSVLKKMLKVDTMAPAVLLFFALILMIFVLVS